MPQAQGITLPHIASLRLCALALNSSKIGVTVGSFSGELCREIDVRQKFLK